MKRIGNLYDKICSIDNIRLAIKSSAKGKTKRNYVKRILNDLDGTAKRIQDMLLSGENPFQEDRHRVISEGALHKERNITIPMYYPDQIIHWCVMLQVAPIIKKSMYEYSCGSVPNRGGIYGKKYVEKILKYDDKVKYILKLDIRKFFPSISRAKLKELLKRKIKCSKTLRLLDMIIDHGGAGDTGLPIGYYSSQWLSNFYLEELDHYIKEKLKIKYYIRYVDDMVLIDSNKRKLHKARTNIDEFLAINNYGVSLKDNWSLYKIGSRPLDFLGFRFYCNYTNLRKHIFIRLNRNVRKATCGTVSSHLARSTLSLYGWLDNIGNGRNYYDKYLKPKITKETLQKIVSMEDKGNG